MFCKFVKPLVGAGFLALSLASAAHAVEVRTAAQDSQPKFIKEGPAITGLCIDIFRALERIDPQLKFQALTGFTPLPRSEYQLQEGELDVICGLAATKERKEKFNIIDIPIYTTHLTLAARKDEKANVNS